MTLEQACNILHVDYEDSDTASLVSALVEALPSYIETTTGLAEENQGAEPLVATVEGFLLTLWYYADHADDQALNRTIETLLKAITIRARSYAE